MVCDTMQPSRKIKVLSVAELFPVAIPEITWRRSCDGAVYSLPTAGEVRRCSKSTAIRN